MSESLGNISIPSVSPSGTFAYRLDYPLVEEIPLPVQTHVIGNATANLKISQRYLLGTGARQWRINLSLTQAERDALVTFWESHKGAHQPFTWAKPLDDKSGTENVTVCFANEPLSRQADGFRWSVTCTFVEWRAPEDAPTYTVSSTVTRVPGVTLSAALLAQVQEIVPLLKITSRQAGYPVMYLSDRRCTVGGQLYLPRMLRWSGISQSLNGESDQAQFILGNADRVCSSLVNDATNGTDLDLADVEFSLYHVGSQIKIDLWKGHVTGWSVDEGNEFQLDCSDGLASLNRMYPPDIIDRVCWKAREGRYNDGTNCPFSSAGSLDLVNFPSASGASCDGGNDTPNGCLAHGMERYYGGTYVTPQGVSIKDNSQGRWGYGRPTLTATSIVGDSIYGQVVPRIFTDADFPVNCKVAAGRDEGEFWDGLLIVGKGPLGAFGSGHTLDGRNHHGFPGSLGLREVLGTDPAGSTDFFSLGQSGNQVGSDFRKIYSGASTYTKTFAAGLAFLELRRSDEKGIQPSLPVDHQGVAIVNQGLSGWIWSGAGSRTSGVLTNPIWIATHALLDMLRLLGASAATCEQFFDVAAAVAAAAICDTSVSKLVGSGSETQYKFRGIIQEQKPFKAWLREVLNTCNGYWTNDFGKLSLGIRSNASAVEAFTEANVLLGSVKVRKRDWEFNSLSVNFANEDYSYSADNLTYGFPEHSALKGESRSGQMNLVGATSRSQAARLAIVRGREEVGGISAAEWKKARQVEIGTTVLALNVKPGMVCSLTHPDMPGGSGKFRVERVVWNGDYSVLITGETVTDSMYDVTTGPKPADVIPSPVTTEVLEYPRRPSSPALTNAIPDPLTGAAQHLLQLLERYDNESDGGAGAVVDVNLFAPRNRFLAVPPPVIRGIATSPTGGSLPAARSYFLQVVAYQNNGDVQQWSPPSNLLAIAVPAGADTATVTIGEVEWPQPPSGSWDGYRILIGHGESSICALAAVVGSSLPSSITASSVKYHSDAATPLLARTRAKAKLVYQPGIIRADVTAVTSTTIQCASLAGGGDDFAGRYVTWARDASDGIPGQRCNWLCTAYDEVTGAFTLDGDPAAAGIAAGDHIYVRWETSGATATSITDAGATWTDDEHRGRMVRIIHGTGRGQVRTISGNTSTTLTIERAWDITPSTDSIFIVEEAGWMSSVDSSEIENLSGQSYTISVPVLNREVPLLVAVFGVSTFGLESPEEDAPCREIYFGGNPGTGGGAGTIQIAY